MTHLNLDTQPEAIRDFVLALVATPNGVVLESGGQAVACVVPPPDQTKGSGSGEKEWTEQQNTRRCELIDQKYDRGLSPAEEAELALLQDAMHRYIDRVAPLPLDETRRLHQQLVEKAAQTGEVSNP